MSYSSLIQSELEQAQSVLNDFVSNPGNFALIEKAANLIADSLAKGGKVISCGNGGSHCDAMHFAEELTGRFRENRKPLPAISISDPSYITCTGNDYGFDHIFSRFVEGVGHKEDVLFALSTSGNSKNVINAVKMAREKGMKTVVLTGNDGGSLAGKADLEIRVPYHGYADRIQEIHIKLIHIIILLVEKLTQKK